MKVSKVYVKMTDEDRRSYFKYTVKSKFNILEGAIDDFEEDVYGTINEKAYKSWIYNLMQLKKFKVYDGVSKHPTLSSLSSYIKWYNSVVEYYKNPIHVDVSLLYSLYKFIDVKNINSFVYPSNIGKYLHSKEIQDSLVQFSIEGVHSRIIQDVHTKLKEFNKISQYIGDFSSINLDDVISKCNKNGKYNKIKEVSEKIGIDKDKFKLFLEYRKTFFKDIEIKNNGWFKIIKQEEN